VTKRVSLYIDGFNLYYALKEKNWQRFYWLNPYELGQNLLQPDQALTDVKYFTARIKGRNPKKTARQANWLEAMTDTGKIKLFYGHYLFNKKDCNKCGAKISIPEEKMTDVNIAVEMLRDAYEDLFDHAWVISGDSDLVPPIVAIRKKFPNKKITVIFPPGSNSYRLKTSANAFLMLGRKTLKDSQFPDQYTKSDGYVLHRPQSWR